ncbi:unnamed protein product (macronuclear) [Paramecium tetraurelia]|uniref:Peptidase S59 domain-containing protein n=1 Tax=Paramecium tetraurelia TaxID=5888 RepID=A0CUE2_PARTE|nr:uncharacterized protein GSPATT00010609001 [Paramecium tetraurelia]CAK74409.1 unnamed protein product [Paramecium tetraurelia]|eukprot:XP_001441806.1 hypothetical protein (macronuclear) [Paramecium tetraurelia strain d4-2]
MAINLFQSSTNNIFGPFNTNSNNFPTNNNFNPTVPGSYRGTFKSQRITYGLMDAEDQNSTLYTTNMFMQQEYKGISAIQIRLEDYYLIRSQQIQDTHKSQLETAVRKNNFNSKLIKFTNQQNLKPPQFQDQNDIFRRQNNSFNQSNDLFKQPNSYQNIFNNPSDNNRKDIFSNNSNDLFNKNNNNNPPNIFNAPPSNNLFNTNNNSAANLFQQQTNNSNNIFQQNNNNNRPFNSGNNNNNIFNQSTNIFSQQPNNNNMFNSQNIFSNNNLFNSNNLFNQPQQNIFNQPMMFQYPNNSNIIQPILQAPLLGSIDYLKFQENQFKDFTQQVDSQIVMFEQQKQLSLEEYDCMLRESSKMNFDYRLQNQYTQSMKSSKTFKLQNQKSSNMSNKTISIRQDKKTSSTYQAHSLNTETKSIFNREDRKPISKFQDNCQYTDSKSEFKSFVQRDERKSQSMFWLDIEIKFLESENSLTIYQEFQIKSRVQNVKQFVENHLENIEIFGSLSQQYFNNCQIYNENTLVVDNSIQLAKLSDHRLIFHYFYVKLPKLIRDGYSSNLHECPDLKQAQNFRVSNKFGKIVWTQPINIYYVDLDKVIDIKQESIEVYDTNKIHELLKPDVGVKLNTESLITFKFSIKNPQINQIKFKNNLIAQAQKQGLQFMSIDFQTFEYTVKSFHFSGYHFNSDYSNTDNQNYQDQQQQVEMQTSGDGDIFEQEENDQEPSEIQSEIELELKYKFDFSFQDMRNKEKSINYQISNDNINKFNSRLSQKIVIPLNFVQQNQQLQIDQNLLQNYFNHYQKQEQVKKSQTISILLLDCLYQCITPSEEIIRSFQLFNILFGVPTIDLVNFLQLQSNYVVSLQDVKKNSKIKYIRGLRLSLYLEQFKIYFNQVEYREQQIIQQQQSDPLQNVFISLNIKPKTHNEIKLNKSDWIDRFTDWRINRSQSQPLYETQWWEQLYNEQKDHKIVSSQYAALIYLLLKKTKQPISEYKKLFEYLHSNLDTYTIILLNIMLSKQQEVSEQLKIIGRSVITKLLKSSMPKQLIFSILETFRDKVFQKEELTRVQLLLGKLGYFNNLDGKDIKDVDAQIDKKQFIQAAKIIIEKRLENQYYSILGQTILPYLVICDYYNEGDLRLLIKHIIDKNNRDDDVIIICQMYLNDKQMNESSIIKWVTKNEYQYHLKQIMLKVYSDQS